MRRTTMPIFTIKVSTLGITYAIRTIINNAIIAIYILFFIFSIFRKREEENSTSLFTQSKY
jgi:hypothetical protein